MKEIFKKTVFISLLFFFRFTALFPQSYEMNSSGSLLEMRPGDILEENFMIDYYSMTRFLHNYSANSLESWTSPSTSILIDGIPFHVMPFNFSSINLLPLNLHQAEEINLIQSPAAQNEIFSFFSSINFKRKEIRDSLIIRYRGYFGSETGDPLFHTFTNPNTPAMNINKIPLSGALSLSDGTAGLRYRLTLGYFGHFSSSSVNDQIMNYRNPRFYNKLDKQVLASGELEMNLPDDRKIKFNSSFISWYGWEIPPFMGTAVHFESLLYSVRAEFENIFRGLFFAIKSDGSLNEINGMTGIPPSKFLFMENSLLSRWNAVTAEKLRIILTPEINLHSIKNKSILEVPVQQDFFKEEFDKISYAVPGTAEYIFNESLSCKLNLRFDKHFSGNSAFSINAGVIKKFSQTELSLSAASAARFPTVSDFSGRFQIYETSEADTDIYMIKGNNLLQEERVNYFGFRGISSLENLSVSVEFFFQGIEKPILQKNSKIKRTIYPGDIIRDADYINGDQKNNYGLKFYSKYKIARTLMTECSYGYIENSESNFFPRHKIRASLEYFFSNNGSAVLGWFYKSSSIAEEFILSEEQDEFMHTGFDGKTPEYSYFNLSVQQRLCPFYFMSDLSFKISVENIFDQKIKFFPVGNETGRTFIFFISGGI